MELVKHTSQAVNEEGSLKKVSNQTIFLFLLVFVIFFVSMNGAGSVKTVLINENKTLFITLKEKIYRRIEMRTLEGESV